MTILSFNNEKAKENPLGNNADEKKENQTNNNNENKQFDKNASTINNSVDDPNWGYDLYPERRGRYKPTFFSRLIGEGKEELTRLKCEGNVYKCIKNSMFFMSYAIIFASVLFVIYCIIGYNILFLLRSISTTYDGSIKKLRMVGNLINIY